MKRALTSRMEVYKRILVPIDFSDESVHAAKRAMEMAPPDGRVDLLHAHHQMMPVPPAMGPPMSPAAVETVSTEHKLSMLQDVADKVRAINPVATVDARVEEGHPVNVIVNASKNYGLIVMTPKAKGKLKRFLLGSVADEAVRQADCPVLIERM